RPPRRKPCLLRPARNPDPDCPAVPTPPEIHPALASCAPPRRKRFRPRPGLRFQPDACKRLILLVAPTKPRQFVAGRLSIAETVRESSGMGESVEEIRAGRSGCETRKFLFPFAEL